MDTGNIGNNKNKGYTEKGGANLKIQIEDREEYTFEGPREFTYVNLKEDKETS